MEMMKITIITINYNNLDGLKQTASSVLHQKCQKNIEYIIIDGKSSDGSAEYLESLPQEVQWISEKDNGISDAFNKGIKMSHGDYILMLNSGDVFISDMVIENFISDISSFGADILSYKVIVNESTSIPGLDDENMIWEMCEEPHQGTFVSKRIYDKIGLYSEDFRIRMDYHFFARCRRADYIFRYIPRPIVKYEPGGVSMKKENRISFWKEGMAVKLVFSLPITIKDYLKFLLYTK